MPITMDGSLVSISMAANAIPLHAAMSNGIHDIGGTHCSMEVDGYGPSNALPPNGMPLNGTAGKWRYGWGGHG